MLDTQFAINEYSGGNPQLRFHLFIYSKTTVRKWGMLWEDDDGIE